MISRTTALNRLMALAALLFLDTVGCTDAGATPDGHDHPPGAHGDDEKEEKEAPHDDDDGHDHGTEATGAVPLPASARDTLGVEFATAERRVVARTRRIPGRIALRPDAVRSYSAPLAGAVTVEVAMLQMVSEGAVLAYLRPPDLRTDQDELHRVRHDIEEATDAVKVHEADRTEGERTVSRLTRRIKTLEAASVRRAELESEQDAARQRVLVLETKLRVARARVERERHHYGLRLRAFAERIGRPVEELEATLPAVGDAPPVQGWETVDAISIRATAAGMVTELPVGRGGWVEAGGEIAAVTDPARWWFEGQILEADVGEVRSGRGAALVPTTPSGRALPAPATLRFGTTADGVRRRLQVFAEPTDEAQPAWIQVGISAFAEVVIEGSEVAEVAVPREAVVRDGAETLLFRRDPKNPDSVTRLPVDVGADDGRWVAVLTGVIAGDQVVTRGAYALKLASSAQARPKGHMHADGSFHPAGEGEEH